MNIEISGLTKEYRGEGETVCVLNGIDLSIESGSIVSVEGASGEGKSTLLNILGTMDHATSGSIKIGDTQITTMKEKAKESFRCSTLGFIFQSHYLLPDFTVLFNVMMPLLIQRNDWDHSRKQATEILQQVGLAHRINHYPNQISGGESARVGVARALVGNKKIILADEPTGNLDKKNSDRLIELLWELQSRLKFTFVIVTHDMQLASRVPIRYKLADGRLEN